MPNSALVIQQRKYARLAASPEAHAEQSVALRPDAGVIDEGALKMLGRDVRVKPGGDILRQVAGKKGGGAPGVGDKGPEQVVVNGAGE